MGEGLLGARGSPHEPQLVGVEGAEADADLIKISVFGVASSGVELLAGALGIRAEKLDP
jgi:hypothetical protein